MPESAAHPDATRLNGQALPVLRPRIFDGGWEPEDFNLPPQVRDDLGEALSEILPDVFPTTLADAFVRERFTSSNGSRLVRKHRGDHYRFDGSAYQELPDDRLRAMIYRSIDRARFRGKNPVVPSINRASSSQVSEVLGALKAVHGVLLEDAAQPPFWIGGGEGRPNAAHLLPMRNGILDLSQSPPKLIPPTPALFAVGALGFDYAPDAPVPIRWLDFLAEVFADPQSIRLAQQWAGLSLTTDTSFQKILLLVGPKRSGKGTFARILTLLNGAGNVCAPTLASLGTNFGLASLMNRRLAIFGDARLSGRTDQAIVAERLLSISGEDSLSIDRKYLDAITLRLFTRLMLISNELPNFRDASGALASRIIVLWTRRSFFGAEDRGLESALIAELPGILNWAIDGYRDLLACGRLVEPESSRDAMRELSDLASPVLAFVEEECEVGPSMRVLKSALFEWWQQWCAMRSIHAATSEPVFSRDLAAACPGLKTERPRGNGGRQRQWVGIRLRTSETSAPSTFALAGSGPDGP